MLSEVRKALADTIRVGAGQARVLEYPPYTLDMPTVGVHIYVQPDESYVQPYMTFSASARAQIDYQVVVHVPADNPARAADAADDLIDPMSTATNVFRAITDNPTLGITTFDVAATPLLGAVQAPEPVLEADGNVRFYRLLLPVQVIVQRS